MMTGKKVTAFLFCLLLAAAPAAVLLTPKTEFSAAEGRLLTAFPRFSLSSLATGEYTAGLESFLQDHFPLRDRWIGMRTALERASGRKEVNGVYILHDRLIEKTDSLSEKSISLASKSVSAFAEQFSGAVSLMLIPTAAEIHRELLPTAAPSISQKTLIDRVYEQMPETIGTVDCYSPLAANQDLYLYYRTDSLWTSLGAYLGYSACSKQMGFTPVASERLNVEHASHDFLGSLYGRTMYKDIVPDTIDIYSLPGSNLHTKVRSYDAENGWTSRDELYFREYLESGSPYSVFLGPEQPVVTIHTDAKKGGSVVIFRDAYAGALAPFLAMHYSTITLVDLELLDDPLETLVNLADYDQALFCYSLKNFAEQGKFLESYFPAPETDGTVQ